MKDFQLRVPAGCACNAAPVSNVLAPAALPTLGTVPRGLRGTLLQSGPNNLRVAHAFCFEQGRVTYRPFDAGHPVCLAGLTSGPACPPLFGSHRKTDPSTGEMFFFGHVTPDGLSDTMAYGSLDAAGRLIRFEKFRAPYASMAHGFAVTRRHLLFPVFPMVPDAERTAAVGPPFAWEPQRGAYLGILQRGKGVESIDWRRAPLCFVFHVMNAWDDGQRVLLDVMQADVPALFTLPDGRTIEGEGSAYLVRWTIDLDLDTAAACPAQELLCDIAGAFPRIDDRFAGSTHRHAWFVGDGAQGQPLARLVHIDHHEGRLDVHALPAGDRACESVFVPRFARAREGVGWLLCVVCRGRSDSSELLVFDARALGAGPVACVRLPCRVPDGSHGRWVDAAGRGIDIGVS
jgi:carotenoid cleavage dioxygenase